jgi:pimeloyl-ACP methyl ester carboxylesterase
MFVKTLRFRVCMAAVLALVFCLCAPVTSSAARAHETVVLDGVPIEVFSYRPDGCRPAGILLVFHGTGRNAADYHGYAEKPATKRCLIVHAPLFDRERFPNRAYHRGGVIRRGAVQPRAAWTVNLAGALAAWARSRDGDIPVTLFGHSAGAQFLSRVAAYAPPAAVARFVIANPSSHVMPDEAEAAPYGFGLLPKAKTALKAYLALPLTIYLGSRDTGGRNLSTAPAARRQGENRLLRGRAVFRAAADLAAANGWPLGWRLVEAAGVGHSARRMLAAPEIDAALGPAR